MRSAVDGNKSGRRGSVRVCDWHAALLVVPESALF
jgi:hypothetical protein